MSGWEWVVLFALIAVLVGATAAFVFVWRGDSSTRLRRQFGPEYDWQVRRSGDRRKAEEKLASYLLHRESITVSPLGDDTRRLFAQRWEGVQARFVDDPVAATQDADRLVTEVMVARGYRGWPDSRNESFATDAGFDDRVALLAYDHPDSAGRYRAAHQTQITSDAHDTENLRGAFLGYRAVFGSLVDSVTSPRRRTRELAAGRRAGKSPHQRESSS